MSVLAIAGSPAPLSRSSRVVDFAAARLIERGVEVDRVCIRELPAEALLHLNHRHPDIQESISRVARAAAIIVATPVYKAAYSGLLKAYLDLLPRDAFRGKVILPIGTAAIPAHGLALDYALKPLLSTLGASCVLDGVYALDQQVSWTPEKGLQLDPEIAYRIEEGVKWLAYRSGSRSAPPSQTVDSFIASHDILPERARCWA
jgi:FMN reductase